MATPHLAGSAAVVRGAHPDWSAEQVRSAIVNTAAMGDVTSSADGSVVTDANITGSGRVDLAAAVGASVAIGPVSTTFGAVPSGSGSAVTAWVTITNLTGSSHTWSLAVTDVQGSGVSFSVGAASVTLAAGESATVAVTMSAPKGTPAGDHQALLSVSGGGVQLAHSVLYVLVK
jgi:subtilisin family serine protease